MKKLLFIFFCYCLTFCSNSKKKQIETWNLRVKISMEDCRIKDSLINLNILPISCSCKNAEINREEFCDSLLNEYLKKNRLSR